MTHPVVTGLRSSDAGERRAACRAAAGDPAAALLVEPLVDALADPDPGVAQAASDALARVGRGAADVLAALRETLRRDAPGRVFAALALARLEPPGPRLLPALVEGLAHPRGDVRWRAARCLVDAGRLHGEVLGLLVGLVRGEGEAAGTRRMAAFALGELAPDLPEAAAALLEASRAADLPVRRAALTAMASLMDPPAPVLERLDEVARSDADPAARRIAGRALELVDTGRGGSPA